MKARLLAPLALLLALAAAARAEDAPDPGAALYEAANRAYAEDKLEDALALYRRVFEETPGSRFADDALFRAADALDRRLQRYEDALSDYRLLSERFPDSPLARRARARMLYLEENLRAGAEPLRLYEDALGRYNLRRPEESIALMERIPREFPGFPKVDDAILWLGDEYARLPGGREKARARYEEARARRPGTEVWSRATFGLAELERIARRYEAARARYREVAERPPTPEVRKAALEYAALMDKHVARRGVLYGAAGLMFAATAVLAVRVPWTRLGREDWRSARAELLLAGPLLAAVLWLAWGELPYVRLSVLLIALSALAALVLNALYLRANPPRGAAALLHPLLAAATMAAAIYAIFYAQDLVFVIEDTFKYGWD